MKPDLLILLSKELLTKAMIAVMNDDTGEIDQVDLVMAREGADELWTQLCNLTKEQQ